MLETYPKAAIEGVRVPGSTGCFVVELNDQVIYDKVREMGNLEKGGWIVHGTEDGAIVDEDQRYCRE